MVASLPQRASLFGISVCALGLTLGLAAGGCGDDGGGREQGAARRGGSQVGGTVVSTVNGHAILIADVQALMRASSLSAREALERLQAEQLLMAEAERRGVGGPALEQVAERARVQALLDMEAATSRATDRELRQAYEKDARFHVPELRTSIHVLARLGADATEAQQAAARAIATKAIADLRTLEPAVVMARYASTTIDGVSVKAESLPAVQRETAFVKEFLDAVFSLPEAGVVPEPVRTRFGWHAVRVTQIAAPRDIPYEEAVKVLRDEITNKKQVEAVSALLTDLRQAHPVTLVPDAPDKLSWVDGADAFRSR